MIRHDQPITSKKPPVLSIRVYFVRERAHTQLCAPSCLPATRLPINCFSEIFVGIMLCDRHVCPLHAGELKFHLQWIRLIAHLTKSGFILLLGQGRGERRMLGGWRWEKQGAECQLGCSIQLHVKWFVILSNHLGQALAPFYLYMTLGQSQYS